MATPVETALVPNMAYAELASDEKIQRTIEALNAHGMNATVVENASEARKKITELLPAGVEVFTANSLTLKELGIADDVDNSERYNSVRAQLAKYDYKTQGREMNKMGTTPEYVIGSVHALTETGSVLVASATGSQLAPYASGAAKVIWVVGSQKIVPDLDEAMTRLEQYTFALEDARALKAYGMHSSINKTLVVHRETTPGRINVIIVKENVGF